MNIFEFDFEYEFGGQTWVGHDECCADSKRAAREKLRYWLKMRGLTNIHLHSTDKRAVW